MQILLSSVGRRVELVRHFRAAYRRLGIEGWIIGTDTDWLAPAQQVVDRAYLVPKVQDPKFIPELLEICRDQQVALLLPLIDPEIPVLARAKDAFQELGVRLGVVDPRPAAVCGDKWLTAQFFHQQQLATPRSILPDTSSGGSPFLDTGLLGWESGAGSEAASRPIPIDYPCFIKPRFGSAGMDAHRCDSPEELRFYLQRVPHPIIQEFIPGPEITSDVICDFQGRCLIVASRQRIAVRSGEAMKSVTVEHPGITEGCRRIAEALPAQGPITIQAILKNSEPYFIEINARLGGGVPLTIAAGIDVPAILLSLVTGLPIESLCQATPEIGLYMTRCDESFFVRQT